MLDRVVSTASVGVMFWGIAVTLLIGLEDKRIVQRLKRVGEYSTIVWYFFESLFACLALLVLSILLEPLNTPGSATLLSGLWLGACVWAATTVVRTFVILMGILIRT